MNCLDFLRIVNADPRCRDDAFLAHRTQCPECASAHTRALRTERVWHNSLKFEVPPDLAGKILLRQSFEPAPVPWYKRRRLLAIAASIVMFSLVSAVVAMRGETARLDQAILAHVYDEAAMTAGGGSIQFASLRSKLAAAGIDLNASVGRVSFASLCVIRGKVAGHIVIREAQGPVTVLFLPADPIDQRVQLADARYTGVLRPFGKGTIALITESKYVRLADVEARVAGALSWRA